MLFGIGSGTGRLVVVVVLGWGRGSDCKAVAVDSVVLFILFLLFGLRSLSLVSFQWRWQNTFFVSLSAKLISMIQLTVCYNVSRDLGT